MLGCDGLVIYFELDANVWKLWNFGAVVLGVLFLVATCMAISVHVEFGSNGEFGVSDCFVLVGLDVIDCGADVDIGKRLADFVEDVPIGCEGGAWGCGYAEFLIEGLWEPHRTEYVLAMEVLIEEPSGGADDAFVVDDDVESSDCGLVEILEDSVDESESG